MPRPTRQDAANAGATFAHEASDGLRSAGKQAGDQIVRLESQAAEIISSVLAVMDQGADEVSTNLTKLRRQLNDAYDVTLKLAQKQGRSVAPIVRDKPYLIWGLASLTGLMIGLLLNSRRQ